MAFGFGKKQENLNQKGWNTAGGGQKGVGSVIISIMAALVVFELGKTLGMLLVQFMLPLFMPDIFSVSEEAAEEMLQQQVMGVNLRDMVNAVLSLVMQLTGALVCFCVWRKQICWKKVIITDPNRPEEVNTPYWLRVISFFALIICGCLGLNLMLNGLQLTMLSQTFMEVAEQQAAVPVAIGIIVYGLAAPLAEEILFRGIIYGKMRRFFGASKALPIAALFFGIYHGNIIQGLYAGILGAVLCFVYEKSGKLWTCILFHGLGNLVVYLLIDVCGVMNHLGNALSSVLGLGLVGLAVGAFVLCFGKKPSLEE